MNATNETVVRSGTSSIKLVTVLGVISLVSGLLLVSSYVITKPTIDAYRKKELEEAVASVVPGAATIKTFVVTEQGLVPLEQAKGNGVRVYVGYDADGKMKGVAAEAAGQGYADLIRVLYGYSPECQCITGIRIVEMRETPGFGDKMYKDVGFNENFKALDTTMNADGNGLANEIVAVKHGTKQKPWQIDAISGATVSSKGVARGLNASAAKVVPEINKHLNELREAH